ncbi:hypothetical protein HDV01_005216 [Terramyces sp. JEL0728]|nr:hypothetical protein HDV01_005216 [Terramyces sp. JEL0728]
MLTFNYKERKKPKPNTPEMELSTTLGSVLFESEHDQILEFAFKKFSYPSSILPEVYLRSSAELFYPLKFALYACGSAYIPDDLVPNGLENRIELASLFVQKAQSFKFEKDHLTVLTLCCIGVVLFNLDQKESMLIHTKFAIETAKSIGLNTEEGIARLSPFDYERENLRRTWWLLYCNFAQAPNSFGEKIIDESDLMLFLPSDNFYFETAGPSEYYGMEVMSSKEWYTPCIYSPSLQANRILLKKILVKIHQYFQLELAGEPESRYIAGCINASLNDWFSSFMPILLPHMLRIKNQELTEIHLSWFAIYIAVLYNSCRVNLIIPKFIKNVIKGKNVVRLLYFKDALEAAIHNSKLIALIVQYNPSVDYLGPMLLMSIFQCAYFLQCCGKIVNSQKIETSYALHMDGLRLFGVAFQKFSRLYNILISMETMTLLDATIFYGLFKRRKMDETMDKQVPNYFENFSDY